MSDVELRQIADDYWEAQMVASPVYATFVGDHRYDHLMDEASEAAEDAFVAAVTPLADAAEALDPDGLTAAGRVTRGLLLAEIRNTRERADMRLAELASDQNTGAHADLLQIAPQTQASDADSAHRLVERYRLAGRYLDQAADRFRSGLGRGRTPAAINVERSLNQVDGYLASSIDEDPFVNLPLPQEADGFDEQAWRADLRTVTEEVIRPAFTRYRAVLADELQPAGRSDDEPKLCHIDDGEDKGLQIVADLSGKGVKGSCHGRELQHGCRLFFSRG